MPYLVNGQHVPKDLIREEFGRIGRDPQWQSVADLRESSPRALRYGIKAPRRSIRLASLDLGRMTSSYTDALIATFRCAAPAPFGAFADKRASWPATEEAARGRSSNPQGHRSSTSVRVAGRVVRRGRSGVERRRRYLRFASWCANRGCSPDCRPSHRHLPSRCDRALRRARR